MSIGYALDESGDPEKVPTAIPPDVLPTHYGRFGTTGSGKSKALINDILSLYENTSGPIILIDPKGDGMTQNYMATHASRFGMDDLEENVLHFPVPDVLPGFSFFDVESAVANGRPREHAVQRKADHYEEILKLVMGTDRYERATVAPTVIKALIKILFDETHGRENGRYRESVDYFAHEQLEHLVDQLLEAGPPNPDIDELPQSSDPEVARTLRRQLQLDPSTFAAVMGGISNRLAYISQDKNLREIFNNLEKQFDFSDFLEEQKVILFDLGDLRDEAARILTGVILTNLNDSLKDAGQLTTPSENPHVVNLLVDEASSIVVSDIMNDLLEKGRGFGLSVGLSMQFPEQIEAEGGRKLYLNALNNIGSTLVSKINVDRELARAMAHEEMDPEEFTNRIRSLPRGEWIASLPSPTFGQTGPYPFSVQPLPIPPGHPESDCPLTHQEKETFTTVLDTIHTRTEEEFGVVDQDISADTTVPTALNDVLRVDSPELDVAIAEVVRNLQLQNQAREENGWIAVENVDTEIRRLYNEADSDPPSYSELSNVRHRSRLLEVTIDAESDSLRIRLTDAGEETALPNTGDVQSAGSQAHDDALLQIEATLSTIDCTVNILPQDGSEMPDARATHPDIDHTFAIEAETTTPDNPAKVLTNLQKAQKAGEIPLFVVLPGDSETDWAKRVEGILSPPFRKLRDGTIQYYTTDSAVTFNGGATEDGGVTAVRPRTENGSSQTRWQRDGDHLVLVDTDGTEYVRVSSVTDLTKDRVPAIYSYDQLANEYIVDEFGQRHTYETKSEFEADWLRIKRPFIPQEELVNVDIDSDTYRIIILRDEDDAVVYKDGSLQPLSTILDDHLRPALSASMEFSDPFTSTSDTQEESPENIDERSVSEDKPPSFESFIQEYVKVDPDEQIPKDRAFERYLHWAEMHGVDDPLNKSWFTRKLKEHIDFESTRLRVEGDLVRHYTGIRVLPVTTEDY
ncbi:helicase HerA domain-containing protein [Halopenitus persicus]|nr:DUF87 domain-containing protein [Halopenitus persicus]